MNGFIKDGEWMDYVIGDSFVDDGLAAVTMVDSQLDENNWPVSVIVMRTGIVVKQYPLYKSNECVYEIPNMVGWSSCSVARWVNEAMPEDVQSNMIMMLQDNGKED